MGGRPAVIRHKNEGKYRAWKAEVEAETRRLRLFGAVLVLTFLAYLVHYRMFH